MSLNYKNNNGIWKVYQNLGLYLSGKRFRLKNSYKIADLFLKNFALSDSPTAWKKITIKDLKDLGIETKSFYSWRAEMIQKNILICQATEEELKEDIANYKGSLFQASTAILKYIEKARELNIKKVVYKNTEDIQEIRINLANTDAKLAKTQETLERVLQAFFALNPPDTDERRKELFGFEK